jgi:hypothetical protein
MLRLNEKQMYSVTCKKRPRMEAGQHVIQSRTTAGGVSKTVPAGMNSGPVISIEPYLALRSHWATGMEQRRQVPRLSDTFFHC